MVFLKGGDIGCILGMVRLFREDQVLKRDLKVIRISELW